MKNPDQAEALQRVCERVIAALPDSLSERKQVLHDLLILNPRRSSLREQIQAMLIHLHDHERAQLNFATLLAPTSKAQNESHNGGAQ
jgi:hypothetical protein